jgi:hypothetical protein
VSTAYEEFLGQKVAFEKSYGFHVNPFELHAVLKPHQREIVAVGDHGRAAGDLRQVRSWQVGDAAGDPPPDPDQTGR